MHRTWVLAFLFACGGGSKPATTTTSTAAAQAGDQCARGADHVVDLMTQVAKDAPAEKIKQFKDSFVEHCQKDKWSAEMQKCVLDAQKQEDFEKCDQFLTAAQKQALGGGEDEGGGQQGGGAPPPPPTQAAPAAAAPKAVMPAPGSSRGPAKKGSGKSGDPCEGGE